jgi:hypothetical protein
MRAKDEEFLIGRANDVINRFSNIRIFNNHLDPMAFYESMRRDKVLWQNVEGFLDAMGNPKLGTIIGVSERKNAYEKSKFFHTTPVSVILDTGVCPVGHLQLVVLAMPVILAAVFDILVAERVARDKAAQSWRDTAERSQPSRYPHWPKPAMRDYVKKHRLPR